MHQHLIQIQQKYSAFGNPALENAQSVKKLIKFLEIRLNKFQLFVIFHKVYKGKILAHLLDTDVETCTVNLRCGSCECEYKQVSISLHTHISVVLDEHTKVLGVTFKSGLVLFT